MIIDSGCMCYAGQGASGGGGNASGGGTNYKKVHGRSVIAANGVELRIAGKFDFYTSLTSPKIFSQFGN